MSQWIDAVADLQRSIAPSAEPPHYAAAVEGCVQRAVAGELDPTGRLALGRYAPFLIPGAGVWLTKKGKYNADDPEARAGLGRAVTRALAAGYMSAAAGFTVDTVPERDERDIFTVWAPSFSDRLENLMGKETAHQVTGISRDVFVDDLKSAGMARWLGGSKVAQIGMILGGAGFLLWFTQSEKMPDDEFEKAVARWTEAAELDLLGRGRWAWDAFALD